MFGPHLIIEAYGCPKELLADLTGISSFLDAMPARLDMTKIMPPYVFKYSAADPNDWGISGVVLIAESHISIHTFPNKGFVTFDIFSCREFDENPAIQYFCESFKPEHFERQLIMRGREFPRSAPRAAEIIEQERVRFAAG
jgi:S-adenosylmethionine decarboxylase